MATYYEQPSRTFSEFLLLPNLTTKDTILEKISLKTPLTRFVIGSESSVELNIPMTSAIMQSVSGDRMSIALARCGGLSFVFASQPIGRQAEMIKKVKKYKAGFVVSDVNATPDDTLAYILELKRNTGHSTVPVTEDGSPNGKLVGIVTSRDYRVSRMSRDVKVASFMTPFSEIVVGEDGLSLSEANDLLWHNKLNCLPVIDTDQRLKHLVFRKDYDEHKLHPYEVLDEHKRLLVGAGINTRDYEDRIPALLEAGADVLCIDSSDGFSQWQQETISYVRSEFGDDVKIGTGNVVDRQGFLYLAGAGADFVKVGIGGGSICITREQKGIGRGQASALIEVAAARDEYFKETGMYVPICSDGGIVHDYHITLALAMGADHVMMGRYFARFDESPSSRVKMGGNYVKEYWAEGSNRARNWERYDVGGKEELAFEEGVDSYVPYAGSLRENVAITVSKIKATMSNCGAASIRELQEKARLTMVSETSLTEGGAHDVISRDLSTD